MRILLAILFSLSISAVYSQTTPDTVKIEVFNGERGPQGEAGPAGPEASDDQTLSRVQDSLEIEQGNKVQLPIESLEVVPGHDNVIRIYNDYFEKGIVFLGDTILPFIDEDNQTINLITFDSLTGVFSLGISKGNSVNIDLSSANPIGYTVYATDQEIAAGAPTMPPVTVSYSLVGKRIYGATVAVTTADGTFSIEIKVNGITVHTEDNISTTTSFFISGASPFVLGDELSINITNRTSTPEGLAVFFDYR